MALLIPDVGEVELLKRMLYLAATSENGTVRMFKNNVTPAEGDTLATYTAADFTGTGVGTLTSSQSGGTWAVPATVGGVTSSLYGTANVRTNSGAAQTIYGCTVSGASTTILWWVDLFATPRVLNTGDSLSYAAKFGLD